ncbi:FxLYD domain-containing protein [Paludisphaera mucosa]|uniref:FxLYD domain-containing protein n=1 Tax=Paludisphaera mucosa TaxID=3030827 RepID=A0ABT6F557_9BACT|nr:FxLYD domain-containing protein [Paludisphaera mucosa]MDG3002578.1 FxLYD domain-containing protein [Paludisphaera mucosa]
MLPALLAVSMLAQSGDPVPGNSMYIPRLGEKAIMYRYDPLGEESGNPYIAFVDLNALIEFEDKRKAYADEHMHLMFDKKSDVELRKLLKPYEATKQVVYLKPKTGVEILGYGNFDKTGEGLRPKVNFVYFPNPSDYLVKVLDGQYKDRIVWVHASSVRVPDSKPFVPFPAIEAAKADGEELFGSKLKKPADDEAAQDKITLIDTDWELDDGYTKVHARVKNTTDRKITFLRATATFEDAKNRLVRTEFTYGNPSTLEPGDVATFEISTKADERIDHYGLKFESKDKNIPFNRPRK